MTDEHSEYNDAVGIANITQVMLASSSFAVKPQYFDPENEEKKFSKKDYIKSFSMSDDMTACVTEIEFSVNVKKANTILLAVKAAYIIVFRFDKGVKEEVARNVVSRIGRFAAYPFFRQHVAQKSWESGAELPLLPIMRQAHNFKHTP